MPTYSVFSVSQTKRISYRNSLVWNAFQRYTLVYRSVCSFWMTCRMQCTRNVIFQDCYHFTVSCTSCCCIMLHLIIDFHHRHYWFDIQEDNHLRLQNFTSAAIFGLRNLFLTDQTMVFVSFCTFGFFFWNRWRRMDPTGPSRPRFTWRNGH